jgi:murein L,D-transpeptidase YcbB/YkuD
MRQDPGRGNALGRIKFMFPNRFSIYLHDTPARHLFQKTVRMFSSGCIRLEKPLDLAQRLLAVGNSGWDAQRLQSALRRGTTQSITLPEPVPVYLVYWTAWVDEEGRVQFRNDIYDRDRRFAKVYFPQET